MPKAQNHLVAQAVPLLRKVAAIAVTVTVTRILTIAMAL